MENHQLLSVMPEHCYSILVIQPHKSPSITAFEEFLIFLLATYLASIKNNKVQSALSAGCLSDKFFGRCDTIDSIHWPQFWQE